MEPVPISALQHFVYCQRQCALIHVESIWDENVFTLRGSRRHARADNPGRTFENGIRSERGLPLWSDLLGLVGKADVVEFHPDGGIVPVEYKSGPLRRSLADDVQLCAQALCLEEMCASSIDTGFVFSLRSKRRREVHFDVALRLQTRETIDAVRILLSEAGPLPPAANDRRCRDCSLNDACVPATMESARLNWHNRRLFMPDIEAQ
jgi:CRISPR-associated exonuclease Cas4